MASLSLAIVGLPNSGKSTPFKALMREAQAQAANFPFTTIEPNVGLVPVPDARMQRLAELVSPEKIVPTTIEFWDIAGLIKGASQGEGLGNQFLGHIRQTRAIIQVVRCFDHPDVIHVNGTINPREDFEVVQLELALSDLETVTKALDRYRKQARGGQAEAIAQSQYAEALAAHLEAGNPARTLAPTTPEHETVLRELQLLTAKPVLLVANVSESDAASSAEAITERFNLGGLPGVSGVIVLSAQVESEIATLADEEQADFLSEYGLKEAGLNRLITDAYRLLKLQTFFTAGKTEVRAWTISVGTKAPDAAGVIHTDFIKGFIRAETIAYSDYDKYNGEAGAQAAGKLRLEGKEYIVQDGDVLHFRVAP